MSKDFYSTLGVSKNASQEDIKAAYRKMSKELHPDKHPSTGSGQGKKEEVERKFKEVNEAYEVLGNPDKRKRYDQFGAAGPAGAGGFSGFEGFDFSGFTAGAGGFADIFESFFGGAHSAGRDRRGEERGADREVQITVDLAECVKGVSLTVSLRRQVKCSECSGNGAAKGFSIVPCKECGGTGQVLRTAQSLFGVVSQQYLCTRCRGSGKVPEKPCPKCGGEGRMTESEQVTISIPAGIEDGQTLRMKGYGDAGIRGAESGDLYVSVRVREDPRFAREGDTIRSTEALPLLTAILGGEVPIETVHGKVTLKIPEGTQPDQVFRLKGRGMPILSSSRHGDHYVTVRVEVPRRLSREERRLLEEWKRIK